MYKSFIKLSLFLFCTIFNQQLFSQSFKATWSFATDSNVVVTGNINAKSAYIDPSLFRTSRTYSLNGLTGNGTVGFSSPICGTLFDSVGGAISPYIELSLKPNRGYNINIDSFSFMITAGLISSNNMYLAAGYSIDDGQTFNGFSISRNHASDSVQGTNGLHLMTNDSLRLSAPMLHLDTLASVKIRIIYWKNNNSTTSSNPITIGPVSISGITSLPCNVNAAIVGKSFEVTSLGNKVVFNISGTPNSLVDYTINNNNHSSIQLNNVGNASITIYNPVDTIQSIQLDSITNDDCKAILNSHSALTLPSSFPVLSIDKGFVIYPNPTLKENVKVYFRNIAEGKYSLRLFNNRGQLIHTKEIIHSGGSAIQFLELERKIPTGLYHLEIKNLATGKKTTQSIVFVQ